MPMPLTQDEEDELARRAGRGPQLTLTLPDLGKWPYFWEIEVGASSMYLKIKQRHWWWPIRGGQIATKAWSSSVYHDGKLAQKHLDTLGEEGVKMAELKNPKREISKQFKTVKFNVPVRVVKS